MYRKLFFCITLLSLLPSLQKFNLVEAEELKSITISRQNPDVCDPFEGGQYQLDELVVISLRCSFSSDHDTVTIFSSPSTFSQNTPVLQNLNNLSQQATWIYDAKADNKAELIIRFSTQPGGKVVAELFDDQDNNGQVDWVITDGKVQVNESPYPTIQVNAYGSWWLDNGQFNLNLEIFTDGPILAGFGGAPDLTLLKNDGNPDFRALVYDNDNDGRPNTEIVQSLFPFPESWSYARTLITTSPPDTEPKISNYILWPYLGSEWGIVKPNGSSPAPIQVNWEIGKITGVGEFVASRGNDANWFAYSHARLSNDATIQADFESPFAFYDLANDADGYPELQVRLEVLAPSQAYTQGSTIFKEPVTSVRFSWDSDNNGQWDYKLGMLGTPQINSTMRVGDLQFQMPNPKDLPRQVITENWPIVTFVEAEGSYVSSEGIYEWSPIPLRNGYFAGISETLPDEWPPNVIQLRGEYLVGYGIQPNLYLSPIDNRLHLKYAEDGVWQLDAEQVIRVTNLDNNETIDVWSREALAATVEQMVEADRSAAKPDVIETLYALAGHLLHTDGIHLTLVAHNYNPMLFETLPPTDHDSWETQRTLLASYEDQRRDPTDLHAWLDAFPGPRSEIAGASLAHVRITDDGFRFELSLEPGYQVTGSDLLNLAHAAPGDYLVENSGGNFTFAPLVPANLSLGVKQVAVREGAAAAQVSVHNAGTVDAPNLVLVVETVDGTGTAVELSRHAVNALAEESTQLLVDVPSSLGKSEQLRVRLEDIEGQLLTTAELGGLQAPALSQDAVLGIGQVPVLLPVLVLFGAFVAGAAGLAIARRQGEWTA